MILAVQQVPSDPNVSIVFDNMVAAWGSAPYPQLSVVLVNLRFLYLCHQTHHWISKGDSFYGDHLLFQRLYEKTLEDIDAMAEKVIGLGVTDNVNIQLQVAQVNQMVQGYGMTQTIPQPTELAKRSLLAEMNFLANIDCACSQLKEMGLMTNGLENMLQGLADVHESHVYLLKQRCSRTV